MYFDETASAAINLKALQETFQMAPNFYNANSAHIYGQQTKNHLNYCRKQILSYFKIEKYVVHFCKGATEANNMMILGQRHRQGNIIISAHEHSSVLGPISYLQSKNIEIRVCPSTKSGKLCLNSLKEMVDHNTFLISVCACDSELGIIQDLTLIARIAKSLNPRVLIHSDITQAIGKVPIVLDEVDAFSFSGHKFGSMKGIGALIIKEKLNLVPHTFGSSFNPGTPPIELIDNMTRCLLSTKENHQHALLKTNKYIRARLKTCPNIFINSPDDGCPNILNISIIGRTSSEIITLLSNNNIAVSAQSACSKQNHSRTVYRLYQSKKRAYSSIRISISHRHSFEEISLLINNLRRIAE